MTVWAEYEKNEVGADYKYKGKRLKLSGLIRNIKKDALDVIVVEIAAKAGEDCGQLRSAFLRQGRECGEAIDARFDDEWAKQVGELERGELLTIECTGAGMTLGRPQLRDCAVEWSQPKGLDAFATHAALSYELCIGADLMPAVAAAMDAGHRLDGGVLTKENLRNFALLTKLKKDCTRQLDAAGLLPLDCKHPAVLIVQGCDGDSSGAPQCDSALVKAAKKHLHY